MTSLCNTNRHISIYGVDINVKGDKLNSSNKFFTSWVQTILIATELSCLSRCESDWAGYCDLVLQGMLVGKNLWGVMEWTGRGGI